MQTIESRRDEPALFVDLDGTLIKTDIVLESLLVLIKARPWVVFLLPLWLLRGRAQLKAEIARRIDLSADGLIFDERLVERLRIEHGDGRQVVLVTTSSRKCADAVADHLGVFSHVIASSETAHLNREAKIAAILAHTKGQPFDYAGNEAADLPIWERARRSICVDTPASVVRVVRGYSGDVEELPRERELRLRTLAKAVRVHQWLKNFLLFVPIAAAHRVSDIKADAHVLIAFAAFSLCASSVYVLNDLTDLRADRLHPRKRKRPFAAGDLDLKTGMLMIPLLLGSSVALSLAFLPLPFFAVLVSYYVGSMAYNFAAKERVIWDVILLAGLYVLRVIAGAAAVPVPISFWLLAFSLFIFLSLALTKRYSEMSTMLKAGRSIATGRGYRTDDMPLIRSMGVVSGYLAVLVMALYINSPEIHALYARPGALWGICPLLLFWISRLWLKTHRGEMHDDPVVFAVRDPMSLAVGGLAAGCVAFGALAT